MMKSIRGYQRRRSRPARDAGANTGSQPRLAGATGRSEAGRNWRALAARAAGVLGVTLCLAAAPGPAGAQDSGTALKPDDIKSEPFKDAKSVGQISKGQRVEILARQSGWLEIKANGKRGWVRLLSVRRGEAARGDVGKELSGVAGLATGRAGTGQVVSSTGVRGLSEADLKHAKFDEAQLQRAEAHAVAAADAKAFAAQGKLGAQQVAFLPDPKAGARP